MRVLRLEPTRRCNEKRACGSPYATPALAVSRPATRGAFTRLVGRVRLAIVPGAARRKTRRGSLYSNFGHRRFFTVRAPGVVPAPSSKRSDFIPVLQSPHRWRTYVGWTQCEFAA